MITNIELLNGSKLDCYPKTSHIFEPLSHDTLIANRQMFQTYVFDFMLSRHLIMSDSRYFLSSIGHYTALNHSTMPCLGAFVEWWIYCNEYSWDINDLPILDIAGNPQTGTSYCWTVDLEGNRHRAIVRNQFVEIIDSFVRISNRYIQAQEECESYSLDYVVKQLPTELPTEKQK